MKQVSIKVAMVSDFVRKLKNFGIWACAMALAVALSFAARASDEPGTDNTATAMPADLRFDVWMDDKPLGTHNYYFSRQTDILQVDSKARFNVKVLFVNVFNYKHHATELWKNHCLTAVTSDTTTNGEEESLDRQFSDDDCHGTYSYWDKTRLQRTELTNAQTGERESASWSNLDPAPLPRPNKKANVAIPPKGITHHLLTTPTATFLLWYDAQGRCLSMQTTNDGRTITYINSEILKR